MTRDSWVEVAEHEESTRANLTDNVQALVYVVEAKRCLRVALRLLPRDRSHIRRVVEFMVVSLDGIQKLISQGDSNEEGKHK